MQFATRLKHDGQVLTALQAGDIIVSLIAIYRACGTEAAAVS